MVPEGVSCYGRHFTIAHVLFTSTESNIVNDQSSDVHFHNVGAGAGRFLSHDKIFKEQMRQKQKPKKAYFGAEIQSVINILKVTPEAQYSFQCKKKNGSKEQLTFEKRQDFQMWQTQLFF